MVIGVYVFASVLTAMVFESYRAQHKTLLQDHRLHTVVALTAAFDCVDANEDGLLDFNEWVALLKRYSQLVPGSGLFADEDDDLTNMHKMRVLFEAMDVNSDGELVRCSVERELPAGGVCRC